jgi:hypothetical protein
MGSKGLLDLVGKMIFSEEEEAFGASGPPKGPLVL